MRSFIRHLLTIATLALAVPSPAPAQTTVLAYYYPWYIEGDWSRHGYVGTPVLGNYGTDSAETARRHVDWCADAGVDGLFVSWWGADHLTDVHLRQGLLRASNLERIRFALFYESLGLLDEADGVADGLIDFDKPGVMEKLLDDFHYMAKNYLEHPRYMKIDGRPVVGFYVTRTFRNLTAEHLSQLREAVDLDLFLVADEVFFDAQSSPETSIHGPDIFDANTAYNMFDNPRVRDDDTALSYQTREAFPIFETWSDRAVFFPGVFPAYHDFRGNRPVAGSQRDFAELLTAAEKLLDRQPPDSPRVLLITSFNEWWEGTTVEPAREYGADYLDVLRKFNDDSTD